MGSKEKKTAGADSNSQLGGILRSAVAAIIAIDDTGIVRSANPATKKLFGYSPAELVGQNISVLMPEPDQSMHDAYIANYLKTGKGKVIGTGRNVTGRRKDATTFPIHLSVSEFEEGGQRYFTGIVHDLSAQDEAKTVTTWLGQIIEDSANEVYVFHGETLRFVNVNRGARENLGYSMDELRDLTAVDIKPEFSQEQFAELIAPLRSGEKTRVRFETVHRRRDGSDYDAEVNLQYTRAVSPPVYVAIILDITARKQAERARRESEERLDLVLEATADGWWDRDLVTGEEVWSDGTYRALGYEPGEIQPSIEFLRSILHPDDLALRDAIYASHIESGQPYNIRMRYRTKSGEYLWFRAAAQVLLDGNAKPERVIGTITNVSDLVEQEERLQRTVQLESLGQLTGGVAHDFNNLLTIIVGNLELLEMKLDDESLETFIREALEASDLGAQLTDRLLSFARRQHLEPQTLNLGDRVLSLSDMLKRTLGERIDLSTAITPDLWSTRADPGQVENAIINLAINARDAMPNGGRLVIEARNAILDAEYAQSEPGLTPGRYVLLSVSDNGTGMDDEVLKKVFDPFFTTKEKGRGSGLGLSMIYGFAKQSSGHVTIHSEVGKGTTVGLYLPAIDVEGSGTVAASDQPGTLQGSGERILIVEDDERVRRLAASRIEALGYRVEQVSSGDEAVSYLDAGGQADLVFTDVVMPGDLSGYDLALHVRKKYPQTPVLLTSGFAEDLVNPDEIAASGLPLLRKPYRQTDLARRLREMIGT